MDCDITNDFHNEQLGYVCLVKKKNKEQKKNRLTRRIPRYVNIQRLNKYLQKRTYYNEDRIVLIMMSKIPLLVEPVFPKQGTLPPCSNNRVRFSLPPSSRTNNTA